MKITKTLSLIIFTFIFLGCSKSDHDPSDENDSPIETPSTKTDLAQVDPAFISSGFMRGTSSSSIHHISSAGPDNKMYVGCLKGSTYGGLTAEGICRINADGSLDPTFNTASIFNNHMVIKLYMILKY